MADVMFVNNVPVKVMFSFMMTHLNRLFVCQIGLPAPRSRRSAVPRWRPAAWQSAGTQATTTTGPCATTPFSSSAASECGSESERPSLQRRHPTWLQSELVCIYGNYHNVYHHAVMLEISCCNTANHKKIQITLWFSWKNYKLNVFGWNCHPICFTKHRNIFVIVLVKTHLLII